MWQSGSILAQGMGNQIIHQMYQILPRLFVHLPNYGVDKFNLVKVTCLFARIGCELVWRGDGGGWWLDTLQNHP